jgi:hypothetical protein
MKSLQYHIIEKLIINRNSEVDELSNMRFTIEFDVPAGDPEETTEDLEYHLKHKYKFTSIKFMPEVETETIFISCKGIDDFLKVCALLSSCYSQFAGDAEKELRFNGDEKDLGDLAYFIGEDYFNVVEKYKKEIDKYIKEFNW